MTQDNRSDDYVICVILPAAIHHALELQARAEGQSIEELVGSLLTDFVSTDAKDNLERRDIAELANRALQEVERLRALLRTYQQDTDI